jgi:HSP20 family protein
MAREISKKDQGSQSVERRQESGRATAWPAIYSPFGMMRRFADEMDRMFEGFGLPSGYRLSPWAWGGEARFSPEVEVLERDGKLIIRADLPGLNKDDVKVDVSEHTLTIEGERRSEHEKNEKGVYRSERTYGYFYREIPLPEGVKTDNAKANFKNGVLEITFDAPKTSENRRHIPIQEESTSSKKGETAA